MSYDDEKLVRVVQAAREQLAELGLELAGPPAMYIDDRTDEELAGTTRKHALHLQILWDGDLPQSLLPDPNAVAGDDFTLSDEDQAIFNMLDPENVKDEEDVPEDDDRRWNAQQAVREAERSETVERFLGLRSKFGALGTEDGDDADEDDDDSSSNNDE